MNDKKWIRTLLTAMLITLTAGCDGISGTGGPSRSADDKQIPKNGQAILGPIVGATVTIRDIENVDVIACSATTKNDDDLAKAGTIEFNTPCVASDHLYLVTIAGGDDIDYNDDGVRDATPVPNTGEFRALLSGAQLLQNDWKTNALTESVYQAMQYAAQTGATDVVETIDDIARRLLRQDLNGDNIIDHRDISAWHPVADANIAINSGKLRVSTALIHQNLNRTLAEIPDAESLANHIDTLAPARQVLAHGNDLLITTDTALLVYHYENGESTLLTSLALGWIYDMATVGNSLYVALGENGIAQIDVGDATRPQITQRWPNPAERITTLGDRVIFSYVNEAGQDALAEISGTSATIIATVDPERWPFPSQVNIRKDSIDESASSGLLKTVDDTVYWSPSNVLRRFVLENDQWQQRSPLLEPTDRYRLTVVDDVEAFNNTLYVVYRDSEDVLALTVLLDSPEFYMAPLNQQFDVLLPKLKRQIKRIDISNAAAPVTLATYDQDDIAAIRRWDSDIIALGKHDISIRYTADLRSKLSLRLPATFSGFYPAKGLARIDDTLVVAAKENGVLFLKTANVPVKKYYGHAFSEGPVINSRVVVKPRQANAGVCELQSDNAGTIAIPEACIADNAYYDIVVSGGEQIVGGTPQAFAGLMHSTLHSSAIMASDWFVSPLTEAAWQLFEHSAVHNFDGIEEAYKILSYWWLSVGFYVHASDIARWNPQTDSSALKMPAERWQLATQAASNATWNDDTSARMIAPFTDFYSLGETITGIAATDDLVFVAHSDSTDVLANNGKVQWLQNLQAGADQVFASDDIFVAIDRQNHRLRAYRTNANKVITQINDVMDPVIDNYSHFCAAGEMLFSFTFENKPSPPVNTFINAWKITGNGLEKMDSLNVAIRDYYYLNCNSDTVIAGTNNHIDVVKLVGSKLQLTDSSEIPNDRFILGMFFDGSRAYMSTTKNDAADIRFVYALDANGRLSPATGVDLQSMEHQIAGSLDINGNKILVSNRSERMVLVNAATQQDIVDIRLPLGISQDTLVSKQTIWAWQGQSVWTIDAGTVLPQ